MGWTKADRAKFMAACESNKPTPVVKQQGSLFEDAIELEPNQRYQSVEIVLLYPKLIDNINGDPVPKQSARFTVTRYSKGDKKGEPVIYKNARTGKNDVIIKSYQDAKITNTVDMLREQIKVQMLNKKMHKFRSAIFISRIEFIFEVSKNAPKYMLNDLRSGEKIYFKDTKPDLDNLEKLIYDAMESEKMEMAARTAMTGLLYDNDAQIVCKTAVFKRWGIRPGVIINLEGPLV